MAEYTDFNGDPALNTSAPPVGAPEGNYKGSHVNDTFRYIMAAIRNLGDAVPKLASGMAVDTEIGTIASQDADDVDITGGTLSDAVAGAVPLKGIIPYGGTLVEAAALAPRWGICDGRTVNGVVTPDLRDRFLKSYASGGNPGGTGGSLDLLTTSNAGAHGHGGATGGRALVQSHLPSIRLFIARNVVAASATPTLSASNFLSYHNNQNNDFGQYALTGQASEPNVGQTSLLGSGTEHTHPISSAAGHTHTVTPDRPPFYAVIFLMRTA